MPKSTKFIKGYSTFIELLSKTVTNQDGCLEWQNARAFHGYGVVRYDGRTFLAHRLALALYTQTSPINDLDALHSCDNPPCINPKHLRWGDAQENAMDMVNRGRQNHPDRRGSKHHMSKLNEQKVLEIRQLFTVGLSNAAIARLYGVTKDNIWCIWHKKTWTHLDD